MCECVVVECQVAAIAELSPAIQHQRQIYTAAQVYQSQVQQVYESQRDSLGTTHVVPANQICWSK